MPTSNAMYRNGPHYQVTAAQTAADYDEDLLEKGFRLAYFMISNRAIAIEILSNAMSKLRVQRSRETKRAYWRDKYLKRKITRVIRDEGDTLQWLIYFEAEAYERQQEQAGEQKPSEMVVRYIKYLVQLTTGMSSFYVNVGLNRLLRNYSTSDVRQLYEWITQHYPGDQEYRKIKGALMNKLKSRFSDFIKTYTADRGEVKFETVDDQASWADLVDKCLRVFTPWSTRQTCQWLAGLASDSEVVPSALSGSGNGDVEHDRVETNRCHVFIDPVCYGRLTEKFNLEPAHLKLAVPRLMLSAKSDENGPGFSDNTPKLTEDERRKITDRLAAESRRRRRVSPRVLRILTDGIECARLEPHQRAEYHCPIQEGTKLIEIWTESDGEDILFATHWVEYTETQGIAPATATVNLGDRNQLRLRIVPAQLQTSAEAPDAVLWLQWRPASRLLALRESLSSPSFWFQTMPKYAFACLLLMAVGWLLSAARYNRQISDQQSSIERLRTELAKEKAAREALETESSSSKIATYALTPDDYTRGPGGPKETVIALSAGTPELILQLPVGGARGISYRAILKSFMDDRQILAEDFATSAQIAKNGKIEFVVPVSLLESGKHYVVDLNSTSASAHVARIHKFTFYLSK